MLQHSLVQSAALAWVEARVEAWVEAGGLQPIRNLHEWVHRALHCDLSKINDGNGMLSLVETARLCAVLFG
jgi:hypothetical protein